MILLLIDTSQLTVGSTLITQSPFASVTHSNMEAMVFRRGVYQSVTRKSRVEADFTRLGDLAGRFFAI